ncbi:ACT domain-containing protein, partial [Mesorhizobium sp. M8A.F.Ca.ET.059.01.1.1]
MPQSYTITLSCDDQPGIVAAVATELSALGANITESNQFWDRLSNRFFMRIAVEFRQPTTKEQVEHAVKPVLDRFGMKADVVDAGRKLKIIIMVSRFDHAMLHLLYQIRVGWLQVEVVAIVSNHEDSRRTAEIEGIPYHVFNITKDNKAEQEKVLLDLVRETEADLVVLARYMQVLSDNLST